jgi:hypothetical protein
VTENPQKINPFLIPGREHMPKTALCPWKWSDHTKFYVDVDNYAESLASFQDQFVNPAALLREASRLVVVAGDSGCGKSALLNHCAHLLAGELREHGLRAVPIDLTKEFDDEAGQETIIDIPQRMSYTCERLVEQLAGMNLIDAASQAKLSGLTDRPRQLYPQLANALDGKGNTDVVLFLILPTMELPLEVERYAALSGRRVVYFAESLLLPSQVDRIARSREAEIRPVTMSVGILNPGDAHRFVAERFAQNKKRGEFPGLADEVVEDFGLSREMSIAQLQQTLVLIYERAMKLGDMYTSSWTIGVREVARLLLHDRLHGTS